ncbi:hypothetical protein ACLOJK_002735 [Asimina triloba]
MKREDVWEGNLYTDVGSGFKYCEASSLLRYSAGGVLIQSYTLKIGRRSTLGIRKPGGELALQPADNQVLTA